MKMDWLRLERRLRDTLKDYAADELNGDEAIVQIDNIIADETLRGCELPENLLEESK